MTAKEYLQQIKELNDVITNKKVELYQLECLATSITAPPDREAVKTSNISDKVGSCATKIVQLEEEIEQAISAYLEARSERMAIIDRVRVMNHNRYIVLFKCYVEYKPLTDIAKEMHLSYDYVREVHIKALRDVAEIMNICANTHTTPLETHNA